MIDIPMITDLLSLSLYQSDDESRFLIGSILKYHKNVMTKTSKLDVHPIVVSGIAYLQEVVDPEIDSTSDDSSASLLLHLASIKGDEAKRFSQLMERVSKSRATVSPKKVSNLKVDIQNKLRILKTEAELRKLFKKCNEYTESTDDADTKSKMMENIHTELDNLTETFSINLERATTLDEVDFSDPASIERAMNIHDERKLGGGFVWGFKGIAKWFEHCGGAWRPGQALMLAAPADSGKSFMLRMIAQWACLYNRPSDKSSKKRKAVVYVCLESEIDKITSDLFLGAWYAENPNTKPPVMNNIQKSDYAYKFYGKRGYILKLLRYGSSELTYKDWIALHNKLMKQYVIEVTILDYVGIMSLEGFEEGNDAKNRQVLQAKIRSFCARNSIRYATAAQVKEAIKEEFRKCKGVAVSIANSNWLADCTSMEKETDIAIYLNVECNHLGDSYLTFKITRHRGESMPPVNTRVFCMKFEEFGIPDDIAMEKSLAIPNLHDIDTNVNYDTLDAGNQPAILEAGTF